MYYLQLIIDNLLLQRIMTTVSIYCYLITYREKNVLPFHFNLNKFYIDNINKK